MIYCYDCRFENRAAPCVGADGRRDFDKLAVAYIDELQARRATGARPAEAWAWECVNELEHADPHGTLFFVLVALDKLDVDTRRCLAVLAAGPLETILVGFGAEIIDAVERIARESPKFRLLLSGVWGKARIDPQVWARVCAVLERGPVMDDDHRTPGYAMGVAPASEGETLALIGTSVLADLGGRAAASAIVAGA